MIKNGRHKLSSKAPKLKFDIWFWSQLYIFARSMYEPYLLCLSSNYIMYKIKPGQLTTMPINKKAKIEPGQGDTSILETVMDVTAM